MKCITLLDTGTHVVNLIEDGNQKDEFFVSISNLDQNGEVKERMMVYGTDAESYKRIAEEVEPHKGNNDLLEAFTKDYEYNAKKYAYYINAGLKMKAEYFRGRCDSIINCLMKIDPERAEVLEEKKLSSYYFN